MESAAMRPWNCWVRCRKNSPAVPGWKIPDIMLLIPDKALPITWIRECWKSILRGRKDALLREVTRQFRWQGKTGTYMRCGGLLMTESRRIFTRSLAGSEGVATVICVLAENVTPFCSPGLLPEGVTVIYREHFLLKLE